jgi:ABC-type Fe3+/spermidine/putrescine transport system ATPase subunit
MGQLVLENVGVCLDRKFVLRHVNLTVANGELLSLLGPSGAGKTTLLRIMAGLIAPDEGRIYLNGRPITGLPPEKRDVVMVFQRPLLFPFMTLFNNIAFGLRAKGRLTADDRNQIARIMAMTQLDGLGRRQAHQLSGGQQQRAALARALVLEPGVLLLDEPLSSLDPNLRQQMRDLIGDIQRQTGITMVFVTHDQTEALMMSDRIALLLDGRLRQTGAPKQLFYHPVDPDVARFFGMENLINGHCRSGYFHSAQWRMPAPTGPAGPCIAAIRPEAIRVTLARPDSGADPALAGRIHAMRFEGTATRLWVNCGNQRVVALQAGAEFVAGQRVYVTFPVDAVHLMPGAFN